MHIYNCTYILTPFNQKVFTEHTKWTRHTLSWSLWNLISKLNFQKDFHTIRRDISQSFLPTDRNSKDMFFHYQDSVENPKTSSSSTSLHSPRSPNPHTLPYDSAVPFRWRMCPHPTDVGLGHLICLGQWNVDRGDGTVSEPRLICFCSPLSLLPWPWEELALVNPQVPEE